ncbi:MAG TPA: bifunctional alpha,alpha-trehalose-phosphate synthase (UDP-forming)/trehalose-phosphatase [Pyrinomonadaceae bacterium]|jgi:trehalose 6-phosphate synthase/phosphatase|nr:bifunctional alpha,alpha-trehalose-phosphate synthase (UDP-forming)/trehalose-phosphatase [Pyrinomonadaceae bacterium]
MSANENTDSRLVVVSNRLPFTLKRAGDSTWRTDRSTGGLATAMGPILKRTGGIWIGWPGDSSDPQDERRQKTLKRWAERERYFAVDIPAETAEGFYEGYSNQTLWPLFHQFPSLLNFKPEHWQAYREANVRFRDVVLEHLRPNDIVWVHDYQLMLLPQLLREAVPDARIGFFLHIPFPSSPIFRLLPRREELLQGLLGADYLAFHTYSYLQHFRASVLRILGLDSRMDRLEVGGRSVRLDALPIGIAPREFTELLAEDAETIKRRDELRARFDGRRVLLGVDRLDYTKGIPERLRTFRRLLKQTPDLRGQVVLIQVAVPSREVIPMYKELRQEVDELVGKINGEFSTPDWTPITYIRRGIPPTELAALYALADLAWVTPLRDGLNLVAKEYVACQQDGAGVLVLSEFAGAASEMGEAFLVNPYDEERTAETIERALQLPADIRRERMTALHKRVLRNNVFAWGDRFIANLREAANERTGNFSEKPQALPVEAAVAAFQQATERRLLLDYDGTLVPYANRPQDAVPPPELAELLATLAADPATAIAVVSGRSRHDLESWFGEVKGLWLAAEHGAIMRSPETMRWELYRPDYTSDWKEQVFPVLEHFMDRTPGSLIEEKEFSLVWHYRMADPEFGEWLANELVSNLEQMLADTELRAYRGQKTVEVKPGWANKGEVLARLSQSAPRAEFCLAAGDDRTDEDLFARLHEDAWTIHIGDRHTRAKYCLSNSHELRRLLTRFAAAGRTESHAAG